MSIHFFAESLALVKADQGADAFLKALLKAKVDFKNLLMVVGSEAPRTKITSRI